MKLSVALALFAPSLSSAFLLPAGLPSHQSTHQQHQHRCAASAAPRVPAPTALWMAKGKSGSNDKKKPQEMEIRHWDEDDEPEFLLITDSKTQATINCYGRDYLDYEFQLLEDENQ
ncbi:Hypothetical protein NocV09_05900190 [Nannochloropsis oceanica]